MSRIQDIKTIRHKDYKKPRAPKSFTPPTIEEVKKHVQDNPELVNVDPVHFWKFFNESDWVDTNEKPVRNWQSKLRTWSRFDHERKENAKHGSKKIGGNNTLPEQFIR
jgi:hypothetical protein